MLNPNTFLIYGGIDERREFVNTSISYDIIKRKLTVLENEKGELPQPRLKPGTLATGDGMVILYGGVHVKGEGFFTDLWHMTVKNNKITFKRVVYPKSNTELFINWRHGFTMHYVRNIKDPILIGGTYGNNQQSRAVLSLPEKVCLTGSEFLIGECSPCPRGSILNGTE